jgi:hypothetical protein
MRTKKRSGHLEKEPWKKPWDSDKAVAEVAALVDFYSDRAVAHASFFVASIFGTLTFLALVTTLQKPVNEFYYLVSILLFLGFAYMGYFTLVRFGYYASISDYLTWRGLQREEVFERYNYSRVAFKQTVKTQELKLPPKMLMKTGEKTKSPVGLIFLYLIYWGGIIFCGAVVFQRFWTPDGNPIFYWECWWFISVLFILLLTIIFPGILYYREKRRQKKEGE